jgi:hypothetical protein
MTINIEALNAANERDARERAVKLAAKIAADEAVRAQVAPAIADGRWTVAELATLCEHGPAVQRQVERFRQHRVLSQSHWFEHGRVFLRLTDPSAPNYEGAGALPRLIEALEACDSTTPPARLAALLQTARYVREWPHAASSALAAFVADLPAIEEAEQRRLEIEEHYATLHNTPKGGH